ncbi:MAG: DUF3667 domain-containing protein [Bacteroidota bacterium]
MADINASENTCKNCNYTFTKQYCNGCGQKNAARITLAHLSHDVMHAVLHADKGIFPYIKRLILNPGVMAREYIAGKRKVFNPMQFLVLSVGFVMLMMTFTNYYGKMEIWEAESMAANPQAIQEKLKGFNTFIKKNSNLIVFFLIPFFALFGSMLFSKKKNNYAEHLMLSVFALSLSNILTLIMLISCYFIGFGIMTSLILTSIITVTSFFLTYKQFYQINWFSALWKSIITYMLTMMVSMIVSTVVGFCILLFT